MKKFLSFGFWNTLAGSILRNRIIVIAFLVIVTILLALQWKNIRVSYTEANLMPEDHPINKSYDEFVEVFGEEGNVIVIGTADSKLFTTEKFKAWDELKQDISNFEEVDYSFGITDLEVLKKIEKKKEFEFKRILKGASDLEQKQLERLEDKLFNELPVYEGLLFNKEHRTIQTAVYLKKKIVNKKARRDLVLNDIIPLVEQFEKENDIEVHISGMPYVRTLNSKYIGDEIGVFIVGALLVTLIIFYFFFRSFRATFIAMITVSVGVMWAFGFLGLLGYEITILTSIIPPLTIVIGIPNCVFLINKYQQEIKKHGNQARSLQRVIAKIGNATLMTNLTTASGFATFIFIKSELLQEFGILASLNIVAIFILSLLIIPVAYSYMASPKEKHLKHLRKKWINKIVQKIENTVRHHRPAVYFSAVGILVLSIIGIYQIRISGSMLEDMPKKAGFYEDILFFENSFNGILPLEILIDAKKEKQITRLSTLKRMQKLKVTLEDFDELSSPVSILRLAKYSKQAFYNGNPDYYQLPNRQERTFILPYVKSLKQKSTKFDNYISKDGRYARMTTYMKDVGTEEMEAIESTLIPKINKIFPKDKYEVKLTGKALIFQKGTRYLVINLFISLGIAILLIAILMAWMFRSFRMILISFIPNLLPLLITAGMMGFFSIPIKPSTILVFSIAFGISVDDTIHFLAKYRQELKVRNWSIKRAVYPALRETTVSMFYTSIVLFFGFSVFMISGFGGTVALGGLVSATLLFAMLANIILLPSLLLSLEKSVSKKERMPRPQINVIEENEDDNEDRKPKRSKWKK